MAGRTSRNSRGFGHSNPVFDRNPAFNGRGGYASFDSAPTPTADQLQGMYDAPAATAYDTRRMTLDDVVVKSAISFGTLILVAAVSFVALSESAAFGLVLPGLIVGLVLGLVISFKQSTNPALILAYAVAEGLVLGGISRAFEAAYDGIVVQAVLGTLAAVAGMLVLYSTKTLRATPKFTKILITAAFGYLALGLVSLVAGLFGFQGGLGLYGVSGLGLLLSVAGVAIASLFLILDFDGIERGIRAGAPARYSWLAAAGLMMTIIWLYLEMLRLIAILRGND